jgi:hypothetical protein
VESKWKNYHIITFTGWSLPETETNVRCFLWRQNNPGKLFPHSDLCGGDTTWKELQRGKTAIQELFEGCAELPGADIDSDHNLLVAKICTRLKKIIRFKKRKPR